MKITSNFFIYVVIVLLAGCKNQDEAYCKKIPVDVQNLYKEANAAVIGKFDKYISGYTAYGDCDWNNKKCAPTQNTWHEFNFVILENIKGTTPPQIKVSITENSPQEAREIESLLDGKQRLLFLKSMGNGNSSFHLIESAKKLLFFAKKYSVIQTARCLRVGE